MTDTQIPVFVFEEGESLKQMLHQDAQGWFHCRFFSDEMQLRDYIQRADVPGVLVVDVAGNEDRIGAILSQLHSGKHTPYACIVVAAHSHPVHIDRLLAQGADEYLIQDEFTFGELAAKIKRAGVALHEAQSRPSSSIRTQGMVNESGINPTDIKVLIIEDDQFLRDLASRKLEQEGFHVTVAIDGNEGLKKIEHDKPDVILLDIILPGIDGFDILKRVRSHAHEAVRNSTVILLSNLGQEADVAKGERLGADDYLIKANFTIDEIISKIHAALEKKRSTKVM